MLDPGAVWQDLTSKMRMTALRSRATFFFPALRLRRNGKAIRPHTLFQVYYTERESGLMFGRHLEIEQRLLHKEKARYFNQLNKSLQCS